MYRQEIGFGSIKLLSHRLTAISSLEGFTAYNPTPQIGNISPTPLLMVVGRTDVLTPTDLALKAYSQANEPK